MFHLITVANAQLMATTHTYWCVCVVLGVVSLSEGMKGRGLSSRGRFLLAPAPAGSKGLAKCRDLRAMGGPSSSKYISDETKKAWKWCFNTLNSTVVNIITLVLHSIVSIIPTCVQEKIIYLNNQLQKQPWLTSQLVQQHFTHSPPANTQCTPTIAMLLHSQVFTRMYIYTHTAVECSAHTGWS